MKMTPENRARDVAKAREKVKARTREKAGAGAKDKVRDAEIDNKKPLSKEEKIMPGFDGNGPMGGGPMTGGARGYCNPGYAGYGRPAGYGRGIGYGRSYGAGRGFRRGYGGRGAPYAPAVASGYAPGEDRYIINSRANGIRENINEDSGNIKRHGSGFGN